jgi:hypothetical protein
MKFKGIWVVTYTAWIWHSQGFIPSFDRCQCKLHEKHVRSKEGKKMNFLNLYIYQSSHGYFRACHAPQHSKGEVSPHAFTDCPLGVSKFPLDLLMTNFVTWNLFANNAISANLSFMFVNNVYLKCHCHTNFECPSISSNGLVTILVWGAHVIAVFWSEQS